MVQGIQREENLPINVQKRNGQLSTFNVSRIESAVANAFKQVEGLPREAGLSEESVKDVTVLTSQVCQVLAEKCLASEYVPQPSRKKKKKPFSFPHSNERKRIFSF